MLTLMLPLLLKVVGHDVTALQFRRHLLPRAPCHDPARREDEGAGEAACPTPFDAAFKVYLANADTVR